MAEQDDMPPELCNCDSWDIGETSSIENSDPGDHAPDCPYYLAWDRWMDEQARRAKEGQGNE